MPALTIENIAPALKQLCAEDVVKQFEQEARVYSSIEQNTKSTFVNGKGWRLPNNMFPPGGHTFFTEASSDFNTPVPFSLREMYVFPTAYALPMEFTGRTITNLKDQSSMLGWLGETMAEYTSAATKQIEELISGDGSGIKAVILSTATPNFTTTIAAAATYGQTKGARYLRQGHTYDVINPANGAVRGTVTILTEGAQTVVTNAALPAGTAPGDYIVDVGAYAKCFRGFAHLINNGTDVLQLLSRADYPYLKSPVLDLAGSELGPASISKLKALLQYRSGTDDGAKSLHLYLSYGQYECLRRQGYNLRRFMDGDKVTGVAGSYTDGDSNFFPNASTDEDRVYFVDLSDFKRYVERDMGLYNLDQQTLRMKPGAGGNGSDKYTAAIGISMNIGIGQPRKHGLIKRAAITNNATEVAAYA